MRPRTFAASLLSLAHLASSQPDITRAADWRWNKASYVDKNGAPASTAGRTSLVPFGIWGTARQGWQLARAWQGGFVPMPNYAAQGTMALMRHVASKQHPEALAAPAPHPFYNIGAQENLGDGGGQAWFGGLAPPASDESDNVYQGLERERPRRGRRKPKKHD